MSPGEEMRAAADALRTREDGRLVAVPLREPLARVLDDAARMYDDVAVTSPQSIAERVVWYQLDVARTILRRPSP